MTYTPALGTEAIAVVKALQRCPKIDYDFGADLVDSAGNVLSDLTPILVKEQVIAQVTRNCTAEIQGNCSLTFSDALTWGRDIIAPYLLAASPYYSDGEPQRFNLGHYVATSPDTGLRDHSVHEVVGYDKIYLLQSDVADTFSVEIGDTYTSGIARILTLAGVADVMVSGELNPAVIAFPGDLSNKTVPADFGDRVYPSDESNTFTFIQIVNDLLKACACRPLWADQNGRYVIEYLPVPATQSSRYVFAASETDLDTAFPATSAVVENADRKISRDVFGIPNRWILIQSGLTFTPTQTDGSDGQLVIDNVPGSDYYFPPSDQATIGRIIASKQYINASDPADFITRAKALVTQQYAQAEKISFETAPWPCAWHYDVLQYADKNLPDTPSRKVQTQEWSLPLTGDPMQWTTAAVAAQ